MAMIQILDDFGQGSQTSLEKRMSSREIAELTNKEHRNVLADCDKLNAQYIKMGLAEISAGVYTLPNTGSQQHRCYELTKIQTLDLMSGYNIELRIKINRRWEELEAKEIFNIHTAPKEMVIAQAMAILQADVLQLSEQNKQLQTTIVEQEPKVLFANSVAVSKTTILVGELAKIIKQNGVDIGQNRLFDWLRNNGFLISRQGSDFNMPSQKSMDLGLFEIKETAVTHSDGHVSINKTPKVTGKGQQYFIEKFLSRNKRSE